MDRSAAAPTRAEVPLERIKLLEQRRELAKPAIFQYGWLKPLEKGYVGARHVVIVKRKATGSPNVEWCRFEERPGAAPPDKAAVSAWHCSLALW